VRREEPISWVAVFVGLLALALFWSEAGQHLYELVTHGTFKDASYAKRQIVSGLVLGGLVSSVAIGIQYLSDIKWLLKNKGGKDA